MIVKRPSKMVIVCDICEKEAASLDNCIVCGKQHCWSCRGIFMGCMIEPDVCIKCDDREDVKAVVERFSKQFVKIDTARARVLAKLPKRK